MTIQSRVETAADGRNGRTHRVVAARGTLIVGTPADAGDPKSDQPYSDNYEYLQEEIERVRTYMILRGVDCERKSDDDKFDVPELDPKVPTAEKIDFLKRKISALEERCASRLAATRKSGDWLPRLEILARDMKLSAFEKNVLVFLVGLNVTPLIRNLLPNYDDSARTNYLLATFLDDLKEQVRHRKYFYKNSPLVSDGIIRLESTYGEFVSTKVKIDQNTLCHILDLGNEHAQLADGTHLFVPTADLDQVILPEAQKNLIFRTVEHFEKFCAYRKRLGFDEKVAYGRGLVLLFHGPSGTGKTLMANALAKSVGKRLMLVNFPSLSGYNRRDDFVLKDLFRESRMQNAVLFFDECDFVFNRRENNAGLPLLLTELERHDGLVILATNRPQSLDEAMHRRITMSIPFSHPDPVLREKIWKAHVPDKVKLADDVDFAYLSGRYELTGGLIKNAIMAGLSESVARDSDNVVLTLGDLEAGAKLQIKGAMQIYESEREIVPQSGLDALILPPAVQSKLREIVHLERARRFLCAHWGFDTAGPEYAKGTVVLFHGRPGTGKTLAAQAMGFELGKSVRLVRPAEVQSCFVGETSKRMESVFRDASGHDAILLFDEADGLFSGRTAVSNSTDRYANMDVNALLNLIENHRGVVILTTNLSENIDHAFRRRFKYVLEFAAPDAGLREKLWRQKIPASMPLDDDVDLERLARQFDVTGANIRNAVFRAAARASMRPENERRVSMSDFVKAAEEESNWETAHKRMGFETA